VSQAGDASLSGLRALREAATARAAAGEVGRGQQTEASRLRAAKAAREFQAVFLMEMLKPLTESLAETGGVGEGNSAGNLYSWFWSEALAGRLAEVWPLPSLPSLPAHAPGAPSAAPRSSTALRSSTAPRSSIAAPPSTMLPSSTALDSGDAGRSLREAARADALATSPDRTAAPGKGKSHDYDPLLAQAASLFKLPANLLRAVVTVESGGRADAVSPRGAVGLMQLMPGTAREMGARDPRDPWDNIYAGAKYLSRQLERFGVLEKALAAYNAGPGAVAEHRGIPPYPETRGYIRKVLEAKAGLDRIRPEDA